MFCKIIIGLALFHSFLFPPEAHAYIDPGVGSMLLQALAAGLVAFLVFGRRIWVFVSSLFSPRKPASDSTDGDDRE